MVVKTVVEAQDIFDKAREGFVLVKIGKKNKRFSLCLPTTHLMMEMKAS